MSENKNLEFRLKPSHVASFLGIAAGNPEYWLYCDEEVFVEAHKKSHEGPQWLDEEGKPWHSDELWAHYQKTLKTLYENPESIVEYIWDVDSVCDGCHRIDRCSEGGSHRGAFDNAETNYSKLLLDLKIGETYKVKDLYNTELFKHLKNDGKIHLDDNGTPSLITTL